MSVVEMKVPTIGESITEVTLSQWLKKDGDYVNIDEAICEFESDKATLEFPAEASGILTHIAKEGDDLSIGSLVAKIDTAAQKPEGTMASVGKEISKSEPLAATAQSSASGSGGHPSPAAAKIMREGEVNPANVAGSGKEGRITKDDAVKAAASQSAAPVQANKAVSAEIKTAPLAAIVSGSRSERVEKMSRMRRTIASRLVSAKNQTAMLTTFNEVDMTGILQLREKYQDQFVAKYGIKLGFMSIFCKACAQILMQMPDVNARLEENHIVYHDYVDISVAISTPTGLVVPPVHNIETIGFHEIEQKIKDLAIKARDGKLTIEEMKGGTFTITNGGVFGSMMSTPIINEPQSAILGMHATKDRAVVIDGKIEIRPMMYLALSYDHRIIDGSTSVTFLVKVKELLEDPMRLMMGI
jgi:2-oxoglutarate dehydrogenase E2 component (dihydrolipoamide succinyltransferase)